MEQRIYMRSLCSCIFIYTLIASSLPVFAKTKEWVKHAQRISGESDAIRNRAIAFLKRIPNLEDKLRDELKLYQSQSIHLRSELFLALDVVSTLKLNGMRVDLQAFAERDETGYSIHALNSMMTKSNFEKSIHFFQQLFYSKKSSMAVKLAVLDTLSRLQIDMDTKYLVGQFEESSPQFQSSILNYIRNHRNVESLNSLQEYLPILKMALQKSGYQIRMQTLFLISEFNPKERILALPVLEKCLKDSHQKVQKFCRSLKGA